MIKIIVNGNEVMTIEPNGKGGVYKADSFIVTRTHSVDNNNVARLVEGLPVNLQVLVDEKEYNQSSVEKLIALAKEVVLTYFFYDNDEDNERIDKDAWEEKAINIIKEIEEEQNTKDKQFAKYKKFVESLCEEDSDLDFWAAEYKNALKKLSTIEELETRYTKLMKFVNDHNFRTGYG